MAASNTNTQVTNLDFSSIKNNLTNYLKSQDTFKDYNFQGSAMSVLLDILAYNTQYNAFYLNMAANEMFLDSALQRSSVISHAKLLNYTPKSAIAPTATINFIASGVNNTSFTLPKFTNFMSEAIDGVNYNFVTTDSSTVPVVSGVATINNLAIKQGIPASTSYVVDSTTNPSYLFQIQDANIDTSTLQVIVQDSVTNQNQTTFTEASNYLTLDGASTVYFLQESLTGQYEIYFGDGVLGKQLADGNIVYISYISTNGTFATGANNFVLMNSVPNLSTFSVIPVNAATSGSEKESIDSIKFQAPKSFSAQGRAVTKNDYITAIQQNNLGFSFDSVNVWGGEENNPPAYGQVFISLKPAGSYSLSLTEKQEISDTIIKPISVLTVQPTIVDPDYTYLKLIVDVYYNPTKTTQSSAQIKDGITSAIQSFSKLTLNTFNSTFSPYDLMNTVQNYNSSILTSEFKLQLQKKILPNLTQASSYKLYFGASLDKESFESGISSSPPIQYRDPSNLNNIIDNVFIEEVPSETNIVESISILNSGFGYQTAPNVTILGDGIGATAHAVIYDIDGSIYSIVIDNPGSGYTTATALITPQPNDTTGQGGAATVTLSGNLGTLRLYYIDSKKIKTILNNNIGTVDYKNGIVNLINFNPVSVENTLGQFAITANPNSNIISSTYNRILTLDIFDPAAITVNVIAKNS